MANQSTQGLLSPFLREQRFSAAKPYVSGSVLDIGCGDGGMTRFCQPDGYYGFDMDPETVENARVQRPGYQFESSMPPEGESFDTIVSLAVIEHLSDPGGSIKAWSRHMKAGGQMVLTTPYPAFEWAHELGAKIGLFSHDAADEHEVLIDRDSLQDMLQGSGLVIDVYKRFLGGANQLFVLKQGAA